MNEENRQYYDAMERLFSTPEWKVFSDSITGWQDAIAAQWRALKPEQLAYEQGRYAALEQVTKHAELCESLKAKELQDVIDSAETI